MDVTHIAEFGKLKYMHVTLNIYSEFLMATTQTRKATKHEITHYSKCFSCMGTQKNTKISPDMLVKHFSNFVPNEISNIRQVFPIILKNKELWSCPLHLKNTTSYIFGCEPSL